MWTRVSGCQCSNIIKKKSVCLQIADVTGVATIMLVVSEKRVGFRKLRISIQSRLWVINVLVIRGNL